MEQMHIPRRGEPIVETRNSSVLRRIITVQKTLLKPKVVRKQQQKRHDKRFSSDSGRIYYAVDTHAGFADDKRILCFRCRFRTLFFACVWRSHIVVHNVRLTWIIFGNDFPCNLREIWGTYCRDHNTISGISRQTCRVVFWNRSSNNKLDFGAQNLTLWYQRADIKNWRKEGPHGVVCHQYLSTQSFVRVWTLRAAATQAKIMDNSLPRPWSKERMNIKEIFIHTQVKIARERAKTHKVKSTLGGNRKIRLPGFFYIGACAGFSLISNSIEPLWW